MTEPDAISQTIGGPIVQDRIEADLRKLGLVPGMALLVHSSLSAMGWVCGGQVAVIRALQSVLTEGGTLVMPSHTGHLSDPATWEHPPVPKSWWKPIRTTMPAFETHLTPTRGMGAIAECFRTWPGVIRSNQPRDSFSAWGKSAVQVTVDHSLEFGLGEHSPLARLYDLGASVLLLGVGHISNTSLHLAEYRAIHHGKKYVTGGAPVLLDGRRQWVEFPDVDLDSSDFEDIGSTFEKETRLARIGKVGMAESRLLPQQEMVDFAVSWMERNRDR
jgi:aminoglycoside 3-N-acetyltransferase